MKGYGEGLPTFVCAVCQLPVERVSTFEKLSGFERTGIVYVFECHGQRQRVELEASLLEDAKSISFGQCFAAEDSCLMGIAARAVGNPGFDWEIKGVNVPARMLTKGPWAR